MNTTRFANVVKTSGTPETYLAFSDPAKDRSFQAVVKSNRVMTVFQEAAGHKTDHGEVGFQPGRSRQFLIFPKSLRAFAGHRIVGINYGLLAHSEAPEAPASSRQLKTPAKPSPKPPAKAKPPAPRAEPAPMEKQTSSGQIKPTVKTPARAAPATRHTVKKASPTRSRPKPTTDDSPSGSPRPSRNVIPFPRHHHDTHQVDELKKTIRRAMNLLEDGKAVAAFNRLKAAVEED